MDWGAFTPEFNSGRMYAGAGSGPMLAAAAAWDTLAAELHAASVDDADFLYVAHDVAPRALSSKIKGFVQPKSWFVDFSPVTMAP